MSAKNGLSNQVIMEEDDGGAGSMAMSMKENQKTKQSNRSNQNKPAVTLTGDNGEQEKLLGAQNKML